MQLFLHNHDRESWAVSLQSVGERTVRQFLPQRAQRALRKASKSWKTLRAQR